LDHFRCICGILIPRDDDNPTGNNASRGIIQRIVVVLITLVIVVVIITFVIVLITLIIFAVIITLVIFAVIITLVIVVVIVFNTLVIVNIQCALTSISVVNTTLVIDASICDVVPGYGSMDRPDREV
jgi:hypothetical protein